MNLSEDTLRARREAFFSRDNLGRLLVVYGFAVGLLLILYALNRDFIGVGAIAGHKVGQGALVSVGVLILLAASCWDLLSGQRQTRVWLWGQVLDARKLLRFAAIVLPLGLMTIAIRQFHLESEAFYDVILKLALVGFVIHYFLPDVFRQPFFLLLSLAGIVAVMGPDNAAWLIGVGLVLLVIANLPLHFGFRVVLLIASAAVLALLRAKYLPAPWSDAIWPILGSMFFIRMIIYVYDSKDPNNKFNLWHSLSYFFLLPNVVFPLSPPVDYGNFRRGYYQSDQFAIYQKGLAWITWGTLNLLAYRAIKYYAVISAEDVNSVATLAQFMLTTFLLYLRVIGQAYIILGICGLFGFNLPRPFDSMFFASSFTDFWRRANIYWKDFMQKVFFYPLFFVLREHGATVALTVGTLVIFVIAWFLHASQWFWLRGVFLIAIPDMLFWSLLGIFVLFNVLREARKRPAPFAVQAKTTRGLMGLTLRVTAFFIAINMLWSMWTSPSIAEWLAFIASVPYDSRALVTLATGLLSLYGAFLAALWLKYRVKPKVVARLSRQDGETGNQFYRVSLALTGVGVALLLISHTQFIGQTSGALQRILLDMRTSRLSDADAARLQRGYYENLTGVSTLSSELWEVYMKRPNDWPPVWASELGHETGDFVEYELLPSVSTIFHGVPTSTNSGAFRDREYTVAKPPDTHRMVWLGASRTMGSGVGDDQTFEQLIEERLNREMAGAPFSRYESLNFSTGGYTVLQRLATLDRIWPYSPDVLIYVPHPDREKLRTIVFIKRMLDEGLDIPFPELRALVERAGVAPGMKDAQVRRLLSPHANKILRWAYGQISAEARAHGAVPVWLHYPDLSVQPRVRENVNSMERIAREAGFRTINLNGVYQGLNQDNLIVAEWDFHPNAQGHELLADAIYASLMEHWDNLVATQ